VVGLAIARQAALSGHEVIVAEATGGIGNGVSSRNSEVIHAGMYYPTASQRAKHCVEGRRMLYAFCASHGVPHRKVGKLIVATDEKQTAKIEGIARQGEINGVEGLELIGSNAARAMEPALSCVAALHSPETGIIDSHSFMLALEGDLEDRGGMIAFNTPVERLRQAPEGWEVRFGGAEAGTFTVDAVINSAGLGAQKIARATEGYSPARVPRLVLAKGNYFGFTGKPVFTRLIYPAPVEGGLGTHVTLDLAGPHALRARTSNGSTRRPTRSTRSVRSRSTRACAPIGRRCRTTRWCRTIAASAPSSPARARPAADF
jgi:L-2-hydroxyglutarate oxidase LhgO